VVLGFLGLFGVGVLLWVGFGGGVFVLGGFWFGVLVCFVLWLVFFGGVCGLFLFVWFVLFFGCFGFVRGGFGCGCACVYVAGGV
ncbi:hypothetical protein DVA80_21060, partial [Acinetobacter baumannii]|uniref:hypothetical protein n=1 Tax=Acinetobacter baumannii TaxID=470 RepID=UPI000E018097